MGLVSYVGLAPLLHKSISASYTDRNSPQNRLSAQQMAA